MEQCKRSKFRDDKTKKCFIEKEINVMVLFEQS